MKNLPTALGKFLLITLIVVGSLFLYIHREQAINLNLIPNEFDHCQKQITASDQEYKNIVTWLYENNEGWATSFITWVPNHTYNNPAFKINVLPDVVVVSYKTGNGYQQLIKSGQHGLLTSCQNKNNNLNHSTPVAQG